MELLEGNVFIPIYIIAHRHNDFFCFIGIIDGFPWHEKCVFIHIAHYV